MCNVSEVRDKIRMPMVKCTSILLVAALCLINVPFSYAEFISHKEVALGATVTLGGGPDSDFDTIPDAWEISHGLDPSNPDDIYEDNDNDGINNIEEYRLRTDPSTSESGIVVDLSATPSNGLQPLEPTFTVDVLSSLYTIVKYEWDFDGNGTYDVWHHASEYEGTPEEPEEPEKPCPKEGKKKDDKDKDKPGDKPKDGDEEPVIVTHKYTSAGPYIDELTGQRFHIAKVRVTDAFGGVGTGQTSIYVNKNSGLSPPTVIPEFNFINVFVPATQRLNATAFDNDDIAYSQWDTTGNGEYDISLKNSARSAETYDETVTRSFYASVKVTDADGLSDIATVGIQTDAAKWNNALSANKPKVYLDKRVIYGRAGVPVSLTGYGVPRVGYAKKLEWDFENDGIYDWASTIDNSDWTGRANRTHTYGAPGIYRAVLKVHTEANVSATNHALVIISENGVPPKANATVSYRNNKDLTEIQEAELPVPARFDHSDSTGDIAKYEWDFDGDKRVDLSTDKPNKKPVYHYRIPGYYIASLTVTATDGLTDTFYIPVFVIAPDDYSSYIEIPKEEISVAGNAITLVCEVFPDNSGVETVMFQYRTEGETLWADIGLGEPGMSYFTTWDTTGLISGATYELRAIVNGEDTDNFEIRTVVVDNNNPGSVDILENNVGGHSKTAKLDSNEANSIVMPNGVTIDIPAGALADSGPSPVISVSENGGFSAGVGNSINIDIQGADEFSRDVTITLPYDDADNDGIVDGTFIDEMSLKVMWFNSATGKWEPLYNSTVYPDLNIVTAQVNHFSLFGLAGIIGGAIGGGGAGSAFSAASDGISYCFIATAAYGTPMAEEVQVLREFRDAYILKSEMGREFVKHYYRHGPSVAKFIWDKPILKALVRYLLKPVIRITKMVVR